MLIIIAALVVLALIIAYFTTTGMTQKVTKYGVKLTLLDSAGSPEPNREVTLGDEFETNVKKLVTDGRGQATMETSLVQSSSAENKLIATVAISGIPYRFFVATDQNGAYLLKAKKQPEDFSVSVAEIPEAEKIIVSGKTIECKEKDCLPSMDISVRLP